MARKDSSAGHVVRGAWRSRAALLLVGLAAATGAFAQHASVVGLSEHQYFEELPVVLSVSRLAQPLNEVPGAVTVIDRELIRRSGARDVAEILRLVPGFLLTYRNGATPQAVYHSALDTYGARMQVYVDGRSVYSSFLFGDTKTGLRGLIVEEIERIEVLRGSNSASYGANAFLGVVNIVTRNAADTRGASASMTGGHRGINDNYGRYGWGDGRQNFRISAARRADRGLENLADDRRESVLQVRADLAPSARDEVRLQLGAFQLSSVDGEGLAGNPFRQTEQGSYHLQMDWRRHIAHNETIDIRASYGREFLRDRSIVRGTLGGSAVSALNNSDGEVTRAEFGAQHSFTATPSLRIVYGGEWRHESLRAPALYSTADALSLHVWRGFGTVEWRPSAQWLLQASGLSEGHSYSGQTFSPRLAANFHVLPDHTLRAGISKSYRAPNFYELRADTRWYNLSPGVALAPVGTQVPVVGWPFLSSGTVKPESLITHELGYLGHVREWNLRIDGRAFVERMNHRIDTISRSVRNPALPANPYTSKDFVNVPGPHLHGFEVSLDWRPLPETRIGYSETHIRSKAGSSASESLEAPHRSSVLTWLQELPGNFEFGLINTTATGMKWAGGGQEINALRRLDMRLGKRFHLGRTKAEASLTIQGFNDRQAVFKTGQLFDPRAFATLKLDF